MAAELSGLEPDGASLPAVASDAHPAAPGYRDRAAVNLDPVPESEQTGWAVAVMGGSVRKGAWEPPETLYAVSVMGGVELDFREADLLEGTSTVVVVAVMGGTKIIVPDDIDVEVDGLGLMGGFEHVSQSRGDGTRPLLRIRGVAIMGGVSVKVKKAPRPGRPGGRLLDRVRNAVSG